MIDTPGGSMRDLTWIIDHEIQLEAWDDEAGSHGGTVLRRLLMVGVLAVKRLEQRQVASTLAVVTNVSGGQPIPLPDPSGQPRYLTNLALTIHPPREAPA